MFVTNPCNWLSCLTYLLTRSSLAESQKSCWVMVRILFDKEKLQKNTDADNDMIPCSASVADSGSFMLLSRDHIRTR